MCKVWNYSLIHRAGYVERSQTGKFLSLSATFFACSSCSSGGGWDNGGRDQHVGVPVYH